MAQQVHRSGSAVTTRQEECMRVGWYERKGAARDVLVVGEMPAPTHRAALSEPCEAADPAIAAGLTAREGEVLRLLTEGVSDREIAAALSISERTAIMSSIFCRSSRSSHAPRRRSLPCATGWPERPHANAE